MTGFDLLHGGALDQAKALYPDAPLPWIDLSTGINPFPYKVPELPAEVFAHLPTSQQFEACRAAMASAFGASERHILVAPGSEILIRLLPDLLDIQSVGVLWPTYGDHLSCWEQSGAKLIKHPNPVDLAGTVDAIVLCNPNNPDGRSWSAHVLEDCRARQAAHGGWLIVDEAYADLYPELSMADQAGADGLLILRSFGKFYGLAGLRLAALLGPERLLEKASRRLGVWPVSGPALHVGACAYADDEWRIKAHDLLSKKTRQIDNVLKDNGLKVLGGTFLFRYVETRNAHILWNILMEQGIYTRRFSWTERHLRIGLPADENSLKRLEAALSL